MIGRPTKSLDDTFRSWFHEKGIIVQQRNSSLAGEQRAGKERFANAEELEIPA
jgi:hypothetical protein